MQRAASVQPCAHVPADPPSAACHTRAALQRCGTQPIQSGTLCGPAPGPTPPAGRWSSLTCSCTTFRCFTESRWGEGGREEDAGAGTALAGYLRDLAAPAHVGSALANRSALPQIPWHHQCKIYPLALANLSGVNAMRHSTGSGVPHPSVQVRARGRRLAGKLLCAGESRMLKGACSC